MERGTAPGDMNQSIYVVNFWPMTKAKKSV